ncbi:MULTISPECIES: hypothetical protein [Maribacter]|uniref:Uncharacterized protein n=2 Tax=Maribacter TaxID=252356 RepID=A0A5B2TV11_9FLAO|nr:MULTISPECIES: hypothetical protein [Maribacter]KAA2218317.1 hypothetical protein F0361_01455 [Maribacter flavus]MDC6404993.1 hypothetical protein [Maribacter sp. PR66]MEE1972407.1 hypothetical protein [Maribacter flavus]TLF45616.1 hypothetical protein FEK29_05715 [Maribacter aurantiacus]
MLQELVDFLQRDYFIFAYIFSLILSIIAYPKYFDTYLKYLPAILAYTLLNEILGYFIRYYPDFSFFPNVQDTGFNDIIYNIYDLIFFPFFFYVYWNLIKDKKYKSWIRTVSILAMLTYLISCFFQNPTHTTLFYANAVASWTLLFIIFLYFYDKRKSHLPVVQPYNLVFWVSLGLIIFHIFAPILFVVGYLRYQLWLDYGFRSILHILIILMHLSFCIGFFVSRKRAFG